MHPLSPSTLSIYLGELNSSPIISFVDELYYLSYHFYFYLGELDNNDKIAGSAMKTAELVGRVETTIGRLKAMLEALIASGRMAYPVDGASKTHAAFK